jgi:DNA-binding GntR family transcriptional regulator
MKMRTLNRRMAELIHVTDWVDVLTLNREFHGYLWNQSPHKVIVAEVERVWSLAAAYLAASYSTVERRQVAVEEHDALLDALASKDVDRLLNAHQVHRESTYSSAEQMGHSH